jgi:hypothetical protein
MVMANETMTSEQAEAYEQGKRAARRWHAAQLEPIVERAKARQVEDCRWLVEHPGQDDEYERRVGAALAELKEQLRALIAEWGS